MELPAFSRDRPAFRTLGEFVTQLESEGDVPRIREPVSIVIEATVDDGGGDCVNDDINAREWSVVVWAIATRMDPSRDLLVLPDTPMDRLDFASPQPGLAGKLGIDGTRMIPRRRRANEDELRPCGTGL
jgi:3-polyprenyl-4-hydroxybenzoate decarboxylase